jgi:hypothetical protein
MRSSLSPEEQAKLVHQHTPVFWLSRREQYLPQDFMKYVHSCELWFHEGEGQPPELVLGRGCIDAASLLGARSRAGFPARQVGTASELLLLLLLVCVWWGEGGARRAHHRCGTRARQPGCLQSACC